jgi:alpha-acetolactate decarboxylase
MKFSTILSGAALIGATIATPLPNNGNGNGNNGHSDVHNDNAKGHNKGHQFSTVNELHQYSVIAALSDGVAANGTLVKNLLDKGNMGLGTFDSLVGEMIVVDGVAYHAKDDKTVTIADPETVETPFAAVTNFKPDVETKATVANFSAFSELVPTWFNSSTTNHFVAYRLDGTFTLRIRAPGGQCYALESLADVSSRQTEWDYENITGTMVGFRTPQYAANINAAGDHLHFITEDRTIAGHVLKFQSVGELNVKAAKLDRYHVEIPASGEIDQVDME